MSRRLSSEEVYGEAVGDWATLYRHRFGVVTHVSADRHVMERLRSIGSRPIPYITLYQQPMFATYQGIELRKHTDWIEVDENGNWKRSSFWDSEDQKNWYVVCPNVKGYVEAALEYVRKLMEDGAAGVFIDNVGQRKRCFGPEFHTHEHLHPTQLDAFADLLRRVREVVREYDPDGLVLLNSASPESLPAEFWEHADADMAESYICTWVSDTRWLDWHNHWNAMGRKVSKWLEKGKTVLALSYLGHTKNPVKDDAYFCYCSARLSGFIWSAGGDVLKGNPAEILYDIRLGEPVEPEREADGVHYRIFQNGIVAVNPEKKEGRLRIPGREGFTTFDLYNESRVSEPGEDVVIPVPPESGRVYLYLPEPCRKVVDSHILRIRTSPPLGNVRLLVDGVEAYTHSGRWKITYEKGPSYGMVVCRFPDSTTHKVEAADVLARGLEISRGYGSVEKLGTLMDPAEPTRPAGEHDYTFDHWRIGSKTIRRRTVEVLVDGEVDIEAVYRTD